MFKMKNNEHIYFSLDSDVLRALAFLEVLMSKEEKGKEVDYNSIDDGVINNYLDTLKGIINLSKKGKIRLLVVNTVYHENKHSKTLVNFMKKYCYFPNINMVNADENASKVQSLVDKYCSPYTFGSVGYDAPFLKTYNAHLGKLVASNDVYIVAESTVENACLITNNSKHIIYNERNEEDKNSRALGVISININEGYCQRDSKSAGFITPRPYSLKTMARFVKKIEEFNTVKQKDDKIKASSVLR